MRKAEADADRAGLALAAQIVAVAVSDWPSSFAARLREPFPWMIFLSDAEQEAFTDELVRTARACASVAQFEPLSTVIHAWMSTAQAKAAGWDRTEDAWLDRAGRGRSPRRRRVIVPKDVQVERPTKRTEHRLVFATQQAQKGGRDLRATKLNALADAWGRPTRHPVRNDPTCHPPKGTGRPGHGRRARRAHAPPERHEVPAPPRAPGLGAGSIRLAGLWTVVLLGAPGQIRTGDTRFRRAVLYPLSYRRVAPG